MNCWQILNIAPTQDKRAIKKAYAALVKVVRPDLDPEGFQRLYGAYQSALELADNIAFNQQLTDAQQAVEPAVVEPVAVDLNNISLPQLNDALNWQAHAKVNLWVNIYRQPQPEVTDGADELDDLNGGQTASSDPEVFATATNQAQSLLLQTENLLQKPAEKNDPQAWQFLLHSPLLLEDDVFHFLQVALAQVIVADLIKQRFVPLENKLQRATLLMLNQYFSWTENDALRDEIGAQQYDELVSTLEDKLHIQNDYKYTQQAYEQSDLNQRVKDSTEQTSAGAIEEKLGIDLKAARFLAFVIDLGVFFAFYLLLAIGAGSLQGRVFVLLLIPFYVVYCLIFENSPRFGTTVGKKLCGLRVVDGHGNQPSFLAITKRVLLVGLTLMVWGVLFRIHMPAVVALTAVLMFLNYRPFWDTLSKTYVIRK